MNQFETAQENCAYMTIDVQGEELGVAFQRFSVVSSPLFKIVRSPVVSLLHMFGNLH